MSATIAPAPTAQPKAPSWRAATLGFTLSLTATTVLAFGLAAL
ncbi:hypothetical protein [Salinarimonas sp.]